VELLDFMWNEGRTTCASSNASRHVDTAEPPLLLSIPFDFDMLGPPELNTSYMLYPKNITRAPTWEIAVKVQYRISFCDGIHVVYSFYRWSEKICFWCFKFINLCFIHAMLY